MAHQILQLAKTTRGSRDEGAVRDEIINSLRENYMDDKTPTPAKQRM